MLTGKQKRYLRSLAMTMRPLITVGKGGISPQFIDGVFTALNKRELVKVSLLQGTDETTTSVAQALTKAIDGLEIAQTIGHTLVLYRVADDVDDRRISLAVDKQ